MAIAAKFVQPIPIFWVYLVPLAVDVVPSFWRVDRIQNDVTMETEVPK
jgi:hypothetical protein